MHVPAFLNRQIFVNELPDIRIELSGTVKLSTNSIRSQPRLGVGVRVGVLDGVTVDVFVGGRVEVGCGVLVGRTVDVGSGVRVGVSVCVIVGVKVFVGVCVNVNVGRGDCVGSGV